jgi:hypothetical protein
VPVTEDALMAADLFDSRTTPPPVPAAPAGPDPAFAARPRLLTLRAALARAVPRARQPRWNEPPAFFFDPRRQAELEAARPAPLDRFAEATALIGAELPVLLASVEVRRTARAIGLSEVALALAPTCPAARELADLLAVPDDEVFLALAPAERTGTRLHLRGAADVAQLYRLLAPPAPGHPIQLYAPAALRSDGTLPTGFAGCEHWLWPTQPLATVPRINGERVVLVGPAVARFAPDIEPRFPTLAVECQVVQTLNVFQVAGVLARLCGRPVPVPALEDASAVARAA